MNTAIENMDEVKLTRRQLLTIGPLLLGTALVGAFSVAPSAEAFQLRKTWEKKNQIDGPLTIPRRSSPSCRTECSYQYNSALEREVRVCKEVCN